MATVLWARWHVGPINNATVVQLHPSRRKRFSYLPNPGVHGVATHAEEIGSLGLVSFCLKKCVDENPVIKIQQVVDRRQNGTVVRTGLRTGRRDIFDPRTGP